MSDRALDCVDNGLDGALDGKSHGGVVFTAASLTGPWQQPEAVFTSTRVALTIMHIVTGSLVTFGLARGIWADDRAVLA